MTSPALDVLQFLVSENYGTIGVDLYDRMIDEPNRMISVSDYNISGTPVLTAGAAVFAVKPRIQVMHRDIKSQYAIATARMWDLWEKLSYLPSFNPAYEAAIPLDTPILYMRDEKERVVFVCNFELTRSLP